MIDPTKKYVMASTTSYHGKSVRILATDMKGIDSIAIAVDLGTEERVMRCGEEHLVEVKPEIERWVNVYPPSTAGDVVMHETRESADLNASSARIACIQLTFKEGDGLEPKPVAEADWLWPEWLTAPWLVISSQGYPYAYSFEPKVRDDGYEWSQLPAAYRLCPMWLDFNPPAYTDWRQSKRKNPRTT